MKVSIELSPEYSEPYAIIYADKITDSIQRTLDIFGSNESPITAFKNENETSYENLIKNTITSIGIALTVFCITGMVFDIAYDGNFSLDNYQFSKMVIGCIIVGLGFGLPAMIYHKDNLPMPFKIIIHMGTGCIIYTIVAYTVGWIGGTSSILHGIIAAIFQIALAFIIWGGFMLHYRNDVRKMNEKIKEL